MEILQMTQQSHCSVNALNRDIDFIQFQKRDNEKMVLRL